MGRKPTPKALKEFRTNPGHRPINKTVSGLPELKTLPPPPAKIGNHGRAFWKAYGPAAFSSGRINLLSLPAWIFLCESVQRHGQAKDELALEAALIMETENGFKKSPLVSIIQEEHANIMRAMKDLCMLPATWDSFRPNESDDDPLEKLLKSFN